MPRVRVLLCALLLGAGLAGCADPVSATGPATPCAKSSTAKLIAAHHGSTHGTVWQLRDLDPRAGNTTPGAPRTPVRRAPYPIAGMSDVIDVASTATTFFAVKGDGTVWVWGQDVFGLFGRGIRRGYSYTPVQVAGVSQARTVDVVGYTVFVQRVDGSILGWGGGGAGLLREGRPGWSPDGQPGITSIEHPTSISRIGGADDTALAVTNDGRVWAWGANLTHIVSAEQGTTLSRVAGLQGVRAVAGTTDTAVAVRADGAVCAWGANTHGEFGQTTPGHPTSNPVQIPVYPRPWAIAAGDRTVYALDSAGRVWAWGDGTTVPWVTAIPQITCAPPPRRSVGYPRSHRSQRPA